MQFFNLLTVALAGSLLNEVFDGDFKGKNSATSTVAVWSLLVTAAQMSLMMFILFSNPHDGQSPNPNDSAVTISMSTSMFSFCAGFRVAQRMLGPAAPLHLFVC